MSYIPYTKGIYRGLSSEEKPVDGLLATELVETDTGKRFRWNDASWVEITEGGGTPSDTVTDEAFGQTQVPGSATAYSRGDHKHGTPANPVPYSHSHAEDDVTNLTTDLAAKETPAGAQAKVDAHKDLTTGVHGAGASTIETIVGSAAKVSTHDGLASPHASATSLEKTASKGAASGYAALDAGIKVPLAQLGGAGADATKFLRGDQTWQVPVGAGDYNLFRFRKAGRYHTFFPDSNGTLALTINRLYAVPFYVAQAVTVTRIAIHVTTLGASANCRLGIYQDNGTLYPGTRISDCGTVVMTSTGIKEITGLNIALSANTLYWLVCVCDVAATIAASAVVYVNALLGYPTTALNTIGFSSYYVAFTYGVLPTPYPGSATLNNAAFPKIAVYW